MTQHLRDGSGKTLYCISDYLGAVKQLPVVIRALHEFMPKLSYSLAGERLVKLVQNELGSKPLVSNYQGGMVGDYILLDMSVKPLAKEFVLQRSENYVAAKVWIDPLKFESRPLISELAQQNLKKRYMLNAETIIVGGSLSAIEMDFFFTALQYYHDPFQAIVTSSWIDNHGLARAQIHAYGLKMSLITDTDTPQSPPDILYLRTQGLLDKFYSIGDIAVIGDSFYHGSGQNPLEPAFYGKRIIAGKYAKNNLRAFEILEQSKLLTRVHENDFPRELRRHVAKHEIASYAAEAKRLIATEQGVAKRFAAALQDYLYSQ